MLAQQLSSLQSLHDLASLCARLGYTTADERENGGHVVARWDRFRVIAQQGGNGVAVARALAHRLSLAGTLALVAVVSDERELILTAPRPDGSGACRLLRLSLDAPSPTALATLRDLGPRRGASALAHALRVAEVLSTETAGAPFFTALRAMLERMTEALDHRHPRDDRRMVALLSLTRVLFLYFVQAKGWLDGNTHFLRDELDRALQRRRHFHRAVLHPLFFGTLNRPPDRRSSRVARGAVPYLNGGLFEPHGVERRIKRPYFTNLLWRDVFDTVFERFRFCVREAEEVDAVHPNMLGHVFERLMQSDERAVSGTFYTPTEVVHELVDACLETAVAELGRVGPAVAADLVRRHRLPPRWIPAVRCALRAIKVLDPAAGSGAFLLGVLERLTTLRLMVHPGRDPQARWRIRRDILARNLFGVDINPVAVRLAELRLWLALVADDPTVAIPQVTPLPNLNGVVRQGDTLLDPLGAAHRVGATPYSAQLRRLARRIAAHRADLFEARGERRAVALSNLNAAERDLAHLLVDGTLARIGRAVTELEAVKHDHDLFGKRVRLSPAQRARLHALDVWRQRLVRERARLEDGGVPFFSFELFAPDATHDRGFDVVIGNPPWVRAERLDTDLRDTLRERFSWWRVDAGTGYRHLPDLAVAFLQRGLELSRPGGVVGMLVPSKVATASYGQRARAALVRETTISYLHRVPALQARDFGATTYPMAVVLQNRAPSPTHEIRLAFTHPDRIRQSSLDRPGPWRLVEARVQEALDEFLASGRPLASEAHIVLGVKTGADRVFVGAVVENAGAVASVLLAERPTLIERRLLRPALRGREVRRFCVVPRRVLVWTHDPDGRPLRTLPPHAHAHVERHGERLRRRSDYHVGAPWTVFRTGAAVAKDRVVWPDIARRPTAAVLEATPHPNAIPLNTCYAALCPDRDTALCAAAVINSSWSAAYAAVSSDEARGGYRRMNASVVGQLPMPSSSAARRALATISLQLHQKSHAITTRTLDDAVAEALDLSTGGRAALRQLANDHLRRPSRRP